LDLRGVTVSDGVRFVGSEVAVGLAIGVGDVERDLFLGDFAGNLQLLDEKRPICEPIPYHLPTEPNNTIEMLLDSRLVEHAEEREGRQLGVVGVVEGDGVGGVDGEQIG